MNKILLTFLALIMFQASTFGQLTIKDANAQVREAKNFHGISISNAFDVVIVQGNEEAVAVSASEDKYRDKIIVEVKDGILYVGLEKGLKWNMGNRKFKAYISFKKIDKLSVSGACDVDVQGTIKSENLSVHLSGASNLTAKVDVGKLRMDLSGASDSKFTGKAMQLDIEASGASKFKGFDLISDYCDASASGASDIKITVNKELNVKASGASDIDYKGSGLIRDLRTSGASSVSRKS